jgi:hypothetical protein
MTRRVDVDHVGDRESSDDETERHQVTISGFVVSTTEHADVGQIGRVDQPGAVVGPGVLAESSRYVWLISMNGRASRMMAGSPAGQECRQSRFRLRAP